MQQLDETVHNHIMSFSMMTHTTFQVPGHNPSPGHLEAALYVENYLSTTKKIGGLFYKYKTFYVIFVFTFSGIAKGPFNVRC